MNKRQTRLFAIGSHRRRGARVPRAHDRQPSAVPRADQRRQASRRRSSHGKDVWHKNNCINCHTLFGEGAYYAPDLTKIAQACAARNTSRRTCATRRKFYDEQRHRRLMPKQDLSDAEITDLIAFLDWVSKVDNQGWPPRPHPGHRRLHSGHRPGCIPAGCSRPVRQPQPLPPGRTPGHGRREPDRAGRSACSARSRRPATPATRSLPA